MFEIDYSDKAIDEIMEAFNNYVKTKHCIPNREFIRQWLNINAHAPVDDKNDWQEAYVIVPANQTISGHDEIIYLDIVEVD